MIRPVLVAALVVAAAAPAAAIKLPDALADSDFRFNGDYSDAKVELGKFLFFDKVLGGNQNVSCATCHQALLAGVDGLPLAIGEGALGLGVTRDLGSGADAVPQRVPRNSQGLFNLGHKSLDAAFHDGRVQVDAGAPSGFDTPAGEDLPLYVDTVMAAQAFFPVASTLEMAGQVGENPQGTAAAAGDWTTVWDLVVQRVVAIPEYVDLFITSFHSDPNIPVDEAADITYVHIANAIFAWEASTFRSQNTPFDRYLQGDKRALSSSAKRGMKLFFGKAECDECHSGALLTDNDYHSLAVPQIGPGAGDGPDGLDDYGRERVTGDVADRFRFRTPPLRGVALTAPYGHAGAYRDLETMVRHHFDAVAGLEGFQRGQVQQPSRPDVDATDFAVLDDAARVAAIAASSDLPALSRPLSDDQIGWLMDFLEQGLTDPDFFDRRRLVPLTVPSGLPVFD